MTLLDTSEDNMRSVAPKQVIVTGHSMMPAAVSETTAIISMIERAARDPAVDIDKLRQLMEMRAQIEAKASERAFGDAMSAAQSEMRAVSADANNPQTKSRYASYFALDKALRPIYTRHGFSLSFNTIPGAPDQYVRVSCRVSAHGHSVDYQIDMPADGKGAKGGDVMTKTHATGSACTYGMRYLLKMIFNVAIGEDDDDGNVGGDAEDKIDQQQVEWIETLINEINAETTSFLKFMKVSRIEDITKRDYPRAVNAINQAKNNPDKRAGAKP